MSRSARWTCRARRRSWSCWQQLKRESGLSILFISHNLAVVRRLCERVLVLYLGRMMELGATAALFARPRHPYTRELLAAIPLPDPELQPARLGTLRAGEAPSPARPALRVCLSHPLPARAGAVRRPGPGVGGGRPRGIRGLPALARTANALGRRAPGRRRASRNGTRARRGAAQLVFSIPYERAEHPPERGPATRPLRDPRPAGAARPRARAPGLRDHLAEHRQSAAPSASARPRPCAWR